MIYYKLIDSHHHDGLLYVDREVEDVFEVSETEDDQNISELLRPDSGSPSRELLVAESNTHQGKN